MLGAERKSMVMKEEERRLTAYHEGGHAICAMRVKGNDPLHKVTIVPRGRALGLAFTLPEDDRVSVTRQQIEARLVMAYGGRTAESSSSVTTRDDGRGERHPAGDVDRSPVRDAVGSVDAIGPILVGDNEQELFLGREIQHRREVSEQTAQLVDAEVKRVIDRSYERAKETLQANIDLLHQVAGRAPRARDTDARGHRDPVAWRQVAAAHVGRRSVDGDADGRCRRFRSAAHHRFSAVRSRARPERTSWV
jgi:cell division protease FtsH